jgi:hypothetical protein
MADIQKPTTGPRNGQQRKLHSRCGDGAGALYDFFNPRSLVDPVEVLAVAHWELSLAWHFIRFAGRFAFEILCQAAVFVKISGPYLARLWPLRSL